jgi:hypothetical protein
MSHRALRIHINMKYLGREAVLEGPKSGLAREQETIARSSNLREGSQSPSISALVQLRRIGLRLIGLRLVGLRLIGLAIPKHLKELPPVENLAPALKGRSKVTIVRRIASPLAVVPGRTL